MLSCTVKMVSGALPQACMGPDAGHPEAGSTMPPPCPRKGAKKPISTFCKDLQGKAGAQNESAAS